MSGEEVEGPAQIDVSCLRLQSYLRAFTVYIEENCKSTGASALSYLSQLSVEDINNQTMRCFKLNRNLTYEVKGHMVCSGTTSPQAG